MNCLNVLFLAYLFWANIKDAMDLQHLFVEVNVVDALLMALRVHGELGLTSALFVRAVELIWNSQWLVDGTFEVSYK